MRIIRWFLATNCRSKPYFKLRERALCQTTMLIDKLNEIKRLANQIQTPINKVTKWHTPARHAKTINPTIAVRLKWAQIRVWTSKLVIILEFRTAYSVRVCVAGCQVSWNGWKECDKASVSNSSQRRSWLIAKVALLLRKPKRERKLNQKNCLKYWNTKSDFYWRRRKLVKRFKND